MKRRHFLHSAVVVSSIPICGVSDNGTSPNSPLLGLTGQTPALTGAEQDAIATALGKKGTYNEAQATYSVPLPRNDLKVTVQGESVPISFGFGGWVAFKKTLDGKQTVMMSDTVLLEAEVNPLIDATHAAGLDWFHSHLWRV